MKMTAVCILLVLLAASAEARVGKDDKDDFTVTRDLQVLDEGAEGVLPETTKVGDNGSPEEVFPLGICQGDCDEDEDCADGLVCVQRDRDTDPVPGCTVTEEAETFDFCVFPDIELIAFQPEQAEVGDFPLGNCEGDCDGNAQCGPGLFCWQRNKGDPVPGCTGIEEYESDTNRPTDFCVLDIYDGTQVLYNMTAAPTRAPTTRPPTAPTNSTQSQPPASAVPLVPLGNVGNNGAPEEVYPLGLCLGDCDNDDECAEGLVCFTADEGDSVPGCTGESDGADVCVPAVAGAGAGGMEISVSRTGFDV